MWEFFALVTGWNDANNPDGGDLPPAMSDSAFDEMLAEHGG